MSLRITDNVDKSARVLQQTAQLSSTTTLSDVEQTTLGKSASQVLSTSVSAVKASVIDIENITQLGMSEEDVQVSVTSTSGAKTTKKRFVSSSQKEQDIEKSDVEQELLKPTSSITNVAEILQESQELLKPTSSITNVAETLPESVSMVSETQTKKRRTKFDHMITSGKIMSMNTIKKYALQELDEKGEHKAKTMVCLLDVPILHLKCSRKQDIDKIQHDLCCNVNTATLFYGLVNRTQNMYHRLDVLDRKCSRTNMFLSATIVLIIFLAIWILSITVRFHIL